MGRLLEKIERTISRWKFSKSERMQKLWIRKGRALDNAGKYREAIVCYDTALGMDPEHTTAMAWSFKGSALLKLGRYQQAREVFQNFIKFAPPQYASYVTEAKKILRDIEAILK